jgi:hypothetical protein
MKLVKQLIFCVIALSVLVLVPSTGFAQVTTKEAPKASLYKKHEKSLWLGVFPALMVVVALTKIALSVQRFNNLEQPAVTSFPLQDVASFK